MDHVVILGGGFAGLTAARRLARAKGMEVTLLDPRSACHFLPMLPDIVGRDLPPELLMWDHAREADARGYRFVRAAAEKIDLHARQVFAEGRAIDYDWLLIATGTRTAFHGNDALAEQCYTLDDAHGVARMREAVDRGDFENAVVIGGGYTGLEIATAIRRHATKRDRSPNVLIVDFGPRILGMLPAWMRRYSLANLARMDIAVRTEDTLAAIEDDATAVLKTGRRLPNALAVWTAGVRAPDVIMDLSVDMAPNGRLTVDDALRVDDRCFAAGDAAAFEREGETLRMAFQFALSAGDHAAGNILRAAQGRPLKPWRPVDLGIIVPMANNRSCGRALGMPVRGWSATFLHFFMCTLRTYGRRHRLAVLKESIRILSP